MGRPNVLRRSDASPHRQRKRVDATHDRGAQRSVHSPVTFDPSQVGESGRGNRDTPVAFAGAVVAGMARVAMTFILDHQFGRCECLFQSGANLRFKCHYFS